MRAFAYTCVFYSLYPSFLANKKLEKKESVLSCVYTNILFPPRAILDQSSNHCALMQQKNRNNIRYTFYVTIQMAARWRFGRRATYSIYMCVQCLVKRE